MPRETIKIVDCKGVATNQVEVSLQGISEDRTLYQLPKTNGHILTNQHPFNTQNDRNRMRGINGCNFMVINEQGNIITAISQNSEGVNIGIHNQNKNRIKDVLESQIVQSIRYHSHYQQIEQLQSEQLQSSQMSRMVSAIRFPPSNFLSSIPHNPPNSHNSHNLHNPHNLHNLHNPPNPPNPPNPHTTYFVPPYQINPIFHSKSSYLYSHLMHYQQFIRQLLGVQQADQIDRLMRDDIDRKKWEVESVMIGNSKHNQCQDMFKQGNIGEDSQQRIIINKNNINSNNMNGNNNNSNSNNINSNNINNNNHRLDLQDNISSQQVYSILVGSQQQQSQIANLNHKQYKKNNLSANIKLNQSVGIQQGIGREGFMNNSHISRNLINNNHILYNSNHNTTNLSDKLYQKLLKIKQRINNNSNNNNGNSNNSNNNRNKQHRHKSIHNNSIQLVQSVSIGQIPIKNVSEINNININSTNSSYLVNLQQTNVLILTTNTNNTYNTTTNNNQTNSNSNSNSNNINNCWNKTSSMETLASMMDSKGKGRGEIIGNIKSKEGQGLYGLYGKQVNKGEYGKQGRQRNQENQNKQEKQQTNDSIYGINGIHMSDKKYDYKTNYTSNLDIYKPNIHKTNIPSFNSQNILRDRMSTQHCPSIIYNKDKSFNTLSAYGRQWQLVGLVGNEGYRVDRLEGLDWEPLREERTPKMVGSRSVIKGRSGVREMGYGGKGG